MAGRTPYPQEMKERAVRMVGEVRGSYGNEYAAIKAVAARLGIGSPETVRKWLRRAQVDAGERPGTTTEEKAEIKALREEIKSLVASMEEPEPQLPLALKSEFARILREGFEKNLPIEKIERQLRGEAHAYQNYLQRERRSNRRGREVRH